MTTACNNEESALFNCKADELWARVKTLNFQEMFPKTVKECVLLVPSVAARPTPYLRHEASFSIFGVEYQSNPLEDDPFQSALSLGSLRKVTYHDGATFVFKLVELSDLRMRVAFELIYSDPLIKATSVLHLMKVSPISESGQSVLYWQTDFSGDCDSNFVQDNKYKKLDGFKELRAFLV